MTQNEQVMRRFVSEILNKGNFSVMDELVHGDYRYRSPEMELKGREALAGLLQGYRAAFPDMQVTVNDMVVAEDRVTMTFKLTGTHQGPLMDVPATGKTIDIHGMILTRFEGGMMVDEFEILDQLSMFQQLGLAG